MADIRASGSQYFCFKEYMNEDGERVFYHANGSLSFQEAQLKAGDGVVPASIVLYVDGTFAKTRLQYRPVYGKYMPLFFRL